MTTDEATEVFTRHRELLFSMVYNLLGTVADTEDVLQETWLAWSGRHRSAEAGPVVHPRAYLVRTAVNTALARRAEISRRRESYFGPWLPEPLIAPAQEDPGERAEAVSIALLVVLETLTPLERAVFVLHEVFGYGHPETAEILGRSPAAVRQLAHRAREHVRARRPRYRADATLRRQATERFAAAVGGGDLDGLLRLLAPDVTLWADGGGKATAAGPRPVRGRGQVARLLVGGSARAPQGIRVRWATANGDPSAVLFVGEAPFAVLVLDLSADGGQVTDIYFVTNPDKLSGANSGVAENN
ncbi:RNA polymerase sigma-70 factor (ECF subfamily) [Kitasatospora sp. SolWspMP-SS2h]|uniref:sigma-70 family RNA polymerase sigma factor n=1 Tax=Kitasatospora sp. SolWspMP-SS2h TaxID=1305729 RepID=UPI000DBA525D|nr:sigma-70 family RNA polymerase sigma factor [Kitasatospora sp. SolWspMP-SS2h]RAJ42198.1 RNA polymerase sigma-70 factor (ECF subfamily) [Kitasatospora sp. SolWspMP-SS2h]